jgi:hypothetical protein
MMRPASARPSRTSSRILSNGTTRVRTSGANNRSARYAVVSVPGTATSWRVMSSGASGSRATTRGP